jgi:hypothetical protein
MQGVRTITAVAALLAALSFAGRAAAQDDQTPQGPLAPNEPVQATGVGIAGGVMVGAELILAVEAIIDVEPIWPWWVFPIVGAAGGGVGGYYLEEASPEGAIALLVAGLVAVIPTAVAISVARAYEPEDDGAVIDETTSGGRLSFEATPDLGTDEETFTEVESRPEDIPEDGAEAPTEPEPDPEPAPEPPGGEDDGESPPAPPTGSARPGRDARTRHLASGSLLHVDRDLGFGFGIPALEMRTGQPCRDAALLGQETGRGLEISFPVLRVDLP